jgi:hypothetical protein
MTKRECPTGHAERSKVVPFRYRLIDATDGRDLGPFVSKRDDWKPGERIGRSKGEDVVIRTIIETEDDVGFRAYLVIVSEDGHGR